MSARARGFTLIELLAVVVIIAIISAVLLPSVTQWVEHRRTADTERKLRSINRAIYGVPGTRDQGFLGDIGRLPGPAPIPLSGTAAFKTELSDGVGFAAGSIEGVQYGWHGAYAPPDLMDEDGWGEPILLLRDGRVRSAGTDRAHGTADDLLYPEAAAEAPLPQDGGMAMTTGSLVVYVRAPPDDQQIPARVQLWKGDGGSDWVHVAVTQPLGNRLGVLDGGESPPLISATWGNGYLRFDGLTQGYHLVVAEGRNYTVYQELRGTSRAYVQAGTVRTAEVELTGAVADLNTYPP